jgi:glucan endo-1,3-alpha-glucosidase
MFIHSLCLLLLVSVGKALPIFPKLSSSSQKYVVAHFMVGNTYPYTVDNWASDIALAYSAGIDAFALNVGSDEWQPQRVADA